MGSFKMWLLNMHDWVIYIITYQVNIFELGILWYRKEVYILERDGAEAMFGGDGIDKRSIE